MCSHVVVVKLDLRLGTVTWPLVEHKLMQSGLPSRTALAAAAHRAAHQVLENGCIFADPLALRILGEDATICGPRGCRGPI